KLLPAHAITKSDGDGALGVFLPDDVLVELCNNLARRQLIQRKLLFFGGSGEVNGHKISGDSRPRLSGRAELDKPLSKTRRLASAGQPRAAVPARSQLFYRNLLIGIDADFASNLHCFFGDLARRKLRVIRQSLGRRLRKWAATADSCDAAIRLDDVSLSAQHERLFFVGNQQQSLQVAQILVSSPVFGEFDRAASDIAVILLQLRFKAAEE